MLGSNYMSNDELADLFKSAFDELHAKIEAMADGATKRKIGRFADIAHKALSEIRDLADGDGMIAPMSGGGPKP
jgi:hypothetical protein